MRFGRRREWTPPEPIGYFAVEFAGDAIPALRHLDERFDVEHELRVGDASSTTVEGVGAWTIDFGPRAGHGASPVLELLLDDAARAVLDAATARASIRLTDSVDVVRAIVATTELADAIASAVGGLVADPVAQRMYLAGEWRVDDAMEPVDPREHITLQSVEGRETWVHTHGLLKFGRPEVEVFVPPELTSPASLGLLDLALYVIGGALVRPGETIGSPEAPIQVREARRERAHWDGLPALELVGSEAAFRAWLAGYL